MLLLNFGRTALAVATALLLSFVDADKNSTESTFISPGGELAFALSVPDHKTDIFFSLRVPIGVSWAGVGLGSTDMKGALFLMIYMNEAGNNVTFSPRLAYGNYEPEYFPDVKFDVLDGTGLTSDGYMVFTARCKEHCRSWPGHDTGRGTIDVSSPNENLIYAVGPKQGFGSNNPRASLKLHREFGSFTMDMKRTQGATTAPVLDGNSKSAGTTMESSNDGMNNWKGRLHGIIMIFCIVALYPIGVVLLRFGGWVRWHGINQVAATVGVLVGFALGIVTSFMYQRSRGFNSAHQVLGIIVTAFVLGQIGLGFVHHMKFKKTQQPTMFGLIHLWLGRIIIFLGTLNAFFGFAFALNRRFGTILSGLVILVCFGSLFLIYGRRYMNRRRHANGPHAPGPYVPGAYAAPPQGYNPEPWRQPPPGYGPPPGYQPPTNQAPIGLQPVSNWHSGERKDSNDSGVNLGRAQQPREFT